MKCPWYDGAPAGLCDAAEGWGIADLPNVFVRAHSRLESHGDRNGHCRICGGPMDLEAWLDKQDERDVQEVNEL